ncbi:MAG: hypothetical protein FWD92_06900 [Methanomassiliicoccaceae archaeon]|nr:hypothetical protein [Methanomassiliicoccaceae archaeon]
MSDISDEGRTHSIHGIHNENQWSDETKKVDTHIRNTWLLHEYIKAMKNNGNLTAETLAEFFYFAAETIDKVQEDFEDVEIDMIDWSELAAFYRGA